jgi:hypothetical protein
MGNKTNPGQFGCHAKAEPDEPLFTLLARDPHAPILIDAWASMRELAGEDPAKVAEARECAEDMRAWRERRSVG